MKKGERVAYVNPVLLFMPARIVETVRKRSVSGVLFCDTAGGVAEREKEGKRTQDGIKGIVCKSTELSP